MREHNVEDHPRLIMSHHQDHSPYSDPAKFVRHSHARWSIFLFFFLVVLLLADLGFCYARRIFCTDVEPPSKN